MTLLIVGAGIAGLVLANLLERLEIDYLLLEGYHSLTPDAGASIVLHPHGLRVLDQIGCYEKIAELAAPADALNHRKEDGRVIYSGRVAVETKKRHFYEVFFLARSDLLRILYENIRDKSKIRSSERVMGVEHTPDGVEVTTSSGMVFTGYGLIGADGIHSTIRKEMWKMADEENHGTLQKDESIPCEWGCVFGISKPTGGIPASEANTIHMHDRTISVMSGLDDRLFWFLFFKLKGAKTYPGIHAIPRFIPDDHAELAAANNDVKVTEAVSFGEIYANRTHATITALPHINFRTWNYRRIMLIGDAAHKFNPISGEGGNAAIEDAAVLASQLHELFQAKQRIPIDEKRSHVNEEELAALFDRVYAARHGRVQQLVDDSHKAMRDVSWDSRLSKFWKTAIVPKFKSNALQEGTSAPVLAGPHCTALPVPVRMHEMPFDDERFAGKPSRGIPAALWGCWK